MALNSFIELLLLIQLFLIPFLRDLVEFRIALQLQLVDRVQELLHLDICLQEELVLSFVLRDVRHYHKLLLNISVVV